MSTPHRLKRTPVLPRGRGVTAAQRAFNPHGEGSNPFDLNGSHQPSAVSHQLEAVSQKHSLWLTADR